MQAIKIPSFNSTQDLIQAVREERWKTGLRPSTCLWNVCKERRLILTTSERHTILSEIAHLASVARQAKVHQKRSAEEKGTMFPLLFTKNTGQVSEVIKESTFATLPAQPRKPSVVQDLLPGIALANSDCCLHHWPRRRKR
jgi:hypothetical protein